ncbi:MAG: site-specific integrase [Nitrosopumilus sp.]|nr:site-specific integrase [Nitrosopumilus sp.]
MVLFENYVHSPKTRELYSTLIKSFCKYHNIPSWDALLQTDKILLKERIEDYLIHLKNDDKSHSHMRNTTFAIQSFLESNDFEAINWKKIRKLLGKDEKPHNSRPYTTDEIKRMLSVAKSLRSRAVILFLSSSGVRRGSIPEMKIKDLKQMQFGCLAVTVYPCHREQYTTFINKEASEALSAYHERRKQQGEILTPESLVFPSVHSNRNNVPVTEKTISFLIRRIKQTAGIGGPDDTNLLVHAFRRRFDTIFKLKDNANVSLVERLMGHSVTVQLDNHYFQPTIENLFAEYQKAMMDLTIDDAERLLVEKQTMQEELDHLEEEKAKNRELESRMSKYEQNQDEMLRVMDLIRSGKATLVKSEPNEIRVKLS